MDLIYYIQDLVVNLIHVWCCMSLAVVRCSAGQNQYRPTVLDSSADSATMIVEAANMSMFGFRQGMYKEMRAKAAFLTPQIGGIGRSRPGPTRSE